MGQESPSASARHDDVEDGLQRITRARCVPWDAKGLWGQGRWGSMKDHWASERSVTGMLFSCSVEVPSYPLKTPFRTVS